MHIVEKIFEIKTLAKYVSTGHDPVDVELTTYNANVTRRVDLAKMCGLQDSYITHTCGRHDSVKAMKRKVLSKVCYDLKAVS